MCRQALGLWEAILGKEHASSLSTFSNDSPFPAKHCLMAATLLEAGRCVRATPLRRLQRFEPLLLWPQLPHPEKL
jgi:hypothetical protein